MERVQAMLRNTSDKAAQERYRSGCSWVLSVQDPCSPADLEAEKVEFLHPVICLMAQPNLSGILFVFPKITAASPCDRTAWECNISVNQYGTDQY